jgi:hypothetical protein
VAEEATSNKDDRGRGMQRKGKGRREWQRAEVIKKEWDGKLGRKRY